MLTVAKLFLYSYIHLSNFVSIHLSSIPTAWKKKIVHLISGVQVNCTPEIIEPHGTIATFKLYTRVCSIWCKQQKSVAGRHCCKSWSAQAWKLLGNVHMCPSQCPSMYTPPVYKK